MKTKLLFVLFLVQTLAYSQQMWRAMGHDDFNRPSTGLAYPAGKNPIWAKNNQIFVFNLEQTDDSYNTPNGQQLSIAKYSGRWEHLRTPFYFSSGDETSLDCAVDNYGTPYVFLANTDDKAVVKKYDGNNWVDLGGGPVSEEDSYAYTIKIGTDGSVYILYNTGATVFVKKFDGSNWTTLAATTDFRWDAKLALDQNNIPYVMYNYTQNNTDYCFVKKYNGTTWEEVGITDFAGNAKSLAIDNNNVPYAFIGNYLRKFNGNSWEIVNSASQIGIIQNSYVDMTFDQANVLYIQYQTATPIFGGLKKLVNGVWESLPNGSGASYRRTGIAFADDGLYKASYDFTGFGSSTYTIVAKFSEGQWEHLTSSGFPTRGIFDFSVCNGIPMTSYIDNHPVYGGKNSVRMFNTSWDYLGWPGISESMASNSKIKAGGDGTIYTAYNNYISDTERKITVKKITPSGWQTVGDVNFSLPAGEKFDLAISHAYEPYVLYKSGRVQKFDGTAWVFVGGSAYNGDAEAKLTFDNNDVPYICLGSAIKKLDAGSWNNLPAFSATSVTTSRILFDPANNLYVAYSDNMKNVHVKQFDGVAWQSIGPDIITAGPTSQLDFALDRNNVLHVLVNEAVNSFRKEASLKKFNGTDWELVGAAQFSAGSANDPKLAFSDNNTPMVGYWAIRGVFFKYFGEADGWLNVKEPEPANSDPIAIVPNPVSDYFTVTGKEINHVTVYDLTGKKIISQPGPRIDASQLQSGIYIVKAAKAEGNVTLKFVKR